MDYNKQIASVAAAMGEGQETRANTLAKEYLVGFTLDQLGTSTFGDDTPEDWWDKAVSDLEVELLAHLSTDDDAMEAVGRQVAEFVGNLEQAKDFIIDSVYEEMNGDRRAYNRGQMGGLD